MRAAPNADPAAWVVAGLRRRAESVLSVVPAGFRTYVRVFHPAYRMVERQITSVRWAEIAAATGTVVHPGMQLGGLTGNNESLHQKLAGVFDISPIVGSLPREQGAPLAAALARHTATPDRCWFAVWIGYGDFEEWVREPPVFERPSREYHLLTGACEAGTELDPKSFEGRSPNIWWPEDRAWCVATEVDFSTTYIGCDESCRDDLLALPEIEALAIDPATGIDYRSDLVNPFVESSS